MFFSSFIFVVLFQLTRSISSPLPYLSIDPPNIEAGIIKVRAVQISDVIITGSSYWVKSYNVTLQRLVIANPVTDYQVIIGISGFDIRYSNDPLSTKQYQAFLSARQATYMTMGVQMQDGAYFQNFQFTYLAIHNLFGQFYVGASSVTVAANLSPGGVSTFVNFSSLSTWATPPSYIGLSIARFKISANDTVTTDFYLRVDIAIINTTDYVILVLGDGAYLDYVTIYILFLGVNVMDNYNRNDILLRNVASGLPNDYVYVQMVSSLIARKTESNFAVFLNFFAATQLRGSFHYYIVFEKLFLEKTANVPQFQGDIILIYRYKCDYPYYYDITQGICIKTPIVNCLDGNQTTCFVCNTNFTLASNNTVCSCSYPIVSGLCFDFTNSPFNGCTNAAYDSGTGQITCLFCSPPQNTAFLGSTCDCKNGFTKDNVTFLCVQVCGDGKRYTNQCDDGNTLNNDGCSSLCTLQTGFICDTLVSPTYCVSQSQLLFELISIIKNEDNSAVMTIQPNRANIPYDLLASWFSVNHFKLLLTPTSLASTPVALQISSVTIANNQIQLQFVYQFTIQDMSASLQIDMSQSRYNTSNPVLKIKTKGDNAPLLFSSFVGLFKTTSTGLMVAAILILILLFVGLIAPKFIGLQAVLTLQLIYYSQLLIFDTSKWPVGFMIFKYLKLSTGYNQLIYLTDYLTNNNTTLKLKRLQLSKLLIQNSSVSFSLLFVAFLVFMSINIVRRLKQISLLDKKQQKNIVMIKQTRRSLVKWLQVNQLCYNLLVHITFWVILQLMCSISTQIMIPNNQLTFSSEISCYLNAVEALGMILMTGMILIMGLNIFANVFLSSSTMGKLKDRVQETNYKKVTFIYLLVMGNIIFFLNDVQIFTLPISLLALFIHIIYMVYLVAFKPYCKSLHFHTIGLLLCQSTYLTFLIILNIINFVSNIDQILILIMGYFILACCFCIIFFTMVRLYYEFRYGQKLQKQLQKQRQMKQKQQLELQEQQLRRKMKIFEQEANAKLNMDENLKKSIQNRYKIQNQVKQDQMISLLKWLQTRGTWSQLQKQEYYFRNFPSKPLRWLQQNDEEQFNKQMKILEQKKQKCKQKGNIRNIDPEYMKMIKKLNQSYQQKLQNDPNEDQNENEESIYDQYSQQTIQQK